MSIRDLIAKLFPRKPELTLDQIREGMSRRRFLRMAGMATVGVAIAPELFELLSPKSVIALPSASCMAVGPFILNTIRGNSLLTMSMITNEALKVLSQHLRVTSDVQRHYDAAFYGGDQWTNTTRHTMLDVPSYRRS